MCPNVELRFAPASDFELLYWSPTLSRRDERFVHCLFPDRYGEWVGADNEVAVVEALKGLDPCNAADECDAAAAMATRTRL